MRLNIFIGLIIIIVNITVAVVFSTPIHTGVFVDQFTFLGDERATAEIVCSRFSGSCWMSVKGDWGYWVNPVVVKSESFKRYKPQ